LLVNLLSFFVTFFNLIRYILQTFNNFKINQKTMKKFLMILGICGFMLVFTGASRLSVQKASATGLLMPNPASEFCEENGGYIETIEDEYGNQSGVCVFEDGSHCNQWDFYYGDCLPKEDYSNLTNSACEYCQTNGGYVDERIDDQGNQYSVCLFNDTSECEVWSYYNGLCEKGQNFSKKSAQVASFIGYDWIVFNSPTYTFDGYNLTYEQINPLRCPGCYEVIYAFESTNGGYGDRTDAYVPQVVTPHTMVLQVCQGKITSAITDNVYDELNGKFVEY
jgi:putative hemolysin